MSLPEKSSQSNQVSDVTQSSTDNSQSAPHGETNSSRPSWNSQLLPSTNTSLVPAENCTEIVQQIRPPNNLQELLNISTSLHSEPGQGETSNLDEERHKFLKAALAHLSVDVVGELKKQIDLLSETQNATKPDKDLEKFETALEHIIDQVCSIDMANVFYQLGGLDVVVPLLGHSQGSLRWLAANVIAECCQNNSYCQNLSITDRVFSPLMEIATKDPDITAKFKAISAISAIVRNNPEGVRQFCKYDGFSMLRIALSSSNEKIVAKTTFLIMALCDTDKSTKDNLVKSGIVETLISLARLTDSLMSEYCVRALLSLMRDHPAATRECLRSELGLRDYLRKTVDAKTSDEAYRELVECANEILQLINNDSRL